MPALPGHLLQSPARQGGQGHLVDAVADQGVQDPVHVLVAQQLRPGYQPVGHPGRQVGGVVGLGQPGGQPLDGVGRPAADR